MGGGEEGYSMITCECLITSKAMPFFYNIHFEKLPFGYIYSTWILGTLGNLRVNSHLQ